MKRDPYDRLYYCEECGEYEADCKCPDTCNVCGAPEGECVHWKQIMGKDVDEEDEMNF